MFQVKMKARFATGCHARQPSSLSGTGVGLLFCFHYPQPMPLFGTSIKLSQNYLNYVKTNI